MSDSAHFVPPGEQPAPPPDFNTTGLSDQRGWLEWVPELVLGVSVGDIGTPAFEVILSSRLRRLQIQYHPDRRSGSAHISR